MAEEAYTVRVHHEPGEERGDQRLPIRIRRCEGASNWRTSPDRLPDTAC
jgi:hypothetical protein